jgi:16S rRNA (uracil1498-N3)-methyltransferase
VEREDLASLAGFFSDARPLIAGENVRLGEDAAHHMRVRRLEVGDRVYVADGVGHQALGSITRLGKRDADVQLSAVSQFVRLPDVHLLVPIADRDRMLWLAEKSTELGLSSWRPVRWRRSQSVSPRGEGASFAMRVRARMQSALIQSHAPWLPEILEDAVPAAAVAAAPEHGSRLVLDVSGEPLIGQRPEGPVTFVVGPEGGLETDELRLLIDASFHPVSLGANVLRFETAAVAALAIVRSLLAATRDDPGSPDG